MRIIIFTVLCVCLSVSSCQGGAPSPKDNEAEGQTNSSCGEEEEETRNMTDPQTAKPGEDVTLPCHCDEDHVIELLEWSRPALKSNKFVFYYRNKSFPNYQHPCYRDRVELMDPEMKNGNASVILKNITINDTGTYECLIKGKKTGRTKRNTPEVMNTIKLKVTGPGAGGGHLGLSVGLVVFVVIVVGLLGFIVRKKLMRKNSEQPAAVAAGEQDPLENSNSKKDECHLNIPLNDI